MRGAYVQENQPPSIFGAMTGKAMPKAVARLANVRTRPPARGVASLFARGAAGAWQGALPAASQLPPVAGVRGAAACTRLTSAAAPARAALLRAACCEGAVPSPVRARCVCRAASYAAVYAVGSSSRSVPIAVDRRPTTCTRTTAGAVTRLPRPRRRRGGMISGTSNAPCACCSQGCRTSPACEIDLYFFPQHCVPALLFKLAPTRCKNPTGSPSFLCCFSLQCCLGRGSTRQALSYLIKRANPATAARGARRVPTLLPPRAALPPLPGLPRPSEGAASAPCRRSLAHRRRSAPWTPGAPAPRSCWVRGTHRGWRDLLRRHNPNAQERLPAHVLTPLTRGSTRGHSSIILMRGSQGTRR